MGLHLAVYALVFELCSVKGLQEGREEGKEKEREQREKEEKEKKA